MDVIIGKNTQNQEGRIYKRKGSNNFIKIAEKMSLEAINKFYEFFISSLKYNL